VKINADLAADEVELVSGLLNNEIVECRHVAKLKRIAGEITQAELDWRLKHADYIESVYVKLFGAKP